MEPLLLPIPDAARALGVGRTSIYGLIAAGDLETVKIGARTLVVEASLGQYVERLRTAGEAVARLA